MENLGSDVLSKILNDLPAEDIIKVCQTNKKFQRVCQDKRYDSLWKEKIIQDYGENGLNESCICSQSNIQNLTGFEKYKCVANKETYLVIWKDRNNEGYSLFVDYDKALDEALNIVLSRGGIYSIARYLLVKNGFYVLSQEGELERDEDRDEERINDIEVEIVKMKIRPFRIENKREQYYKNFYNKWFNLLEKKFGFRSLSILTARQEIEEKAIREGDEIPQEYYVRKRLEFILEALSNAREVSNEEKEFITNFLYAPIPKF